MSYLIGTVVLATVAAPAFASDPLFVTYSGRLTNGTGWEQSQTLWLRFRLHACERGFGEDCIEPCVESAGAALQGASRRRPRSGRLLLGQPGDVRSLGPLRAPGRSDR